MSGSPQIVPGSHILRDRSVVAVRCSPYGTGWARMSGMGLPYGLCDKRFAPVREAFAANFAERGEQGAAVCVMAGGRVVVDLAGGWADLAGTRPWEPDTLVNVFS